MTNNVYWLDTVACESARGEDQSFLLTSVAAEVGCSGPDWTLVHGVGEWHLWGSADKGVIRQRQSRRGNPTRASYGQSLRNRQNSDVR